MKRKYDLTKGNKSIKSVMENEERKFIQKEFENYRASIIDVNDSLNKSHTLWSEDATYKSQKNMHQMSNKNYFLLEKIKESLQPYSRDNTTTDRQNFLTYIKEKNLKNKMQLPEKFISESLQLTKKFKNSLLNNQENLIRLVKELKTALDESDSMKFLNTFRNFSAEIESNKIKPINNFFYFFNKSTQCNEFKFLEKIKNLAHKYEVDIQINGHCFDQANVK
jgi:hypothetical protein